MTKRRPDAAEKALRENPELSAEVLLALAVRAGLIEPEAAARFAVDSDCNLDAALEAVLVASGKLPRTAIQ